MTTSTSDAAPSATADLRQRIPAGEAAGAPSADHRVTLALRAAQAPVRRYLWTPDHTVEFTPAVLSESFGDGRALFAVTTINNRPRYWIVRGCSSWRVDRDFGAPGSAADIGDHIDAILDGIENEFGSRYGYIMNARGDWVDEETGRFVPRSWTDYPVIDMDMGCSWGRLDWPALDGVALEPHPFARCNVLAAPGGIA